MALPFRRISPDQLAALVTRYPFARRIDSVLWLQSGRPDRAGFAGPITLAGLWRRDTARGEPDVEWHLAVDPVGGIWLGRAAYAAAKLAEFCRRHPGAVKLYASGHSAGSIFHASFVPEALKEGVPHFRGSTSSRQPSASTFSSSAWRRCSGRAKGSKRRRSSP
jgi:hypothetical protein